MSGKKRNKILVVDDQESMRDFLQIMLTKEGYEVVLAADGEQACRILDKETFDLIISDIRMPGESGLELVLRILCDAPAYLNEGGVLVVEVGNSAAELERRFPDLPFLWLEFERGGEGVFLMKREQLTELHPLFEKELEKL